MVYWASTTSSRFAICKLAILTVLAVNRENQLLLAWWITSWNDCRFEFISHTLQIDLLFGVINNLESGEFE